MPSPVFSYALSLSRLLVSQLESVSALCSGADLTIPPEPSAEVVEDPSTGTLVCDSTALSSWGYAGWTMASALSKEIQSLRDWKESSMEGWSALDPQAVGKALGLPLGSAVVPAVLPHITKLAADRDAMAAVLRGVERWLGGDNTRSLSKIRGDVQAALGANPEIPSTVDLESHAVWLLEKAGGVVSDPSLPTRERVRVLLVRMLLADGLVEMKP